MKKSAVTFLALLLMPMMSMAMTGHIAAAELDESPESSGTDCTEKLTNPSFENGSTGWTVNKGKIEVKGNGPHVVTAYNYQVDICQIVYGLEPGHYVVKVRACSRYMDGKAGIDNYEKRIADGKEIPNEAYLYANGVQKKVKNIFDETSTTYDFAKLSGQPAANLTMSNGGQIPYNSANFVTAFGVGMYENELECTVGKDGMLMIGIKNELSGYGFQPYIAYDNFRLYRKCGLAEDETSKIDLYDLHAEAGKYVAVCMPYVVKSEYFGQVYRVGQIKEGQAVLVAANAIGVGEPCIIKASGESKVSAEDVTLVYTTPKNAFSLWDNTMIAGDFKKLTWTATDANGAEVNMQELTYVEADLSNMNFTCTIENYAAARFWAENPDYTADGTSTVSQYISLPAYNRTDQPNPVRIPIVASEADQTLSYSQSGDMTGAETITVHAGESVADIYNLMPGTTYHYTTADGKSAGQFTVGGKLRMIMAGNNAVNMRDLGGKQVSDAGGVKYVRYGKLFRNAEMKGNSFNIRNDELAILNNLNIGSEVDLRNTDGNRPWLQNAARDDNYYWAEYNKIIANGLGKMYEEATISNLKKEFEFIVSNLRKGVAVDIHCRIGADRTGFLCFMLQGLLGVSESDLLKDYETTSFSAAGLRAIDSGDGDADAGTYKEMFPKEFSSKIPEGGTLRDVFEDYFTNTLEVSTELISEFRSIMLGNSPLPDMKAERVRLLQTKANAKNYVQSLTQDIENQRPEFASFVEDIDGARNATIAILLRDEAKETISKYKYVTISGKKYVLSEKNGEYVLESEEGIVFTDKTEYESDCEFNIERGLTYSRTFSTGWQALYVPFAMGYNDWAENFDVASINNFHEYTDEYGNTTKVELEVRFVNGGRLKANHPYLIRAKNAEASPQTITISACTLYKSATNSIDCSSVERKYTFTGTYEPVTGLATKGYIFMSSGKLAKSNNDEDALPAQRWFLSIASRDNQIDGYGTEVKDISIDINVIGEATGIEEVSPESSPTSTELSTGSGKDMMYNLNGMRVDSSYKGIVIRNGKKYLMK